MANDGATSGVSVPRWALVVGVAVLALLLGGGAVALLSGGSNDSATGTTTTSNSTTTTLASPVTQGGGGSGGGGSSGSGGSSGGGGTTGSSSPAGPKLTNVMANPNFATCPVFGGDTQTNITWDSVNATSVQMAVFTPSNGQYMSLGDSPAAQGGTTVTIPCNGKQQHLIAVAKLIVTGQPEQTDQVDVYVNEGIQGT